MNREEVRELLTEASAIDGRPFTETMVMAWHKILRDLRPEQAMAALENHFATSDRRLMPAHIVEGVKEVRAQLMGGFQDAGQSLEVPDANPDDVGAYLLAVKSQRMRAGDGEQRPVKALVASLADRKRIPPMPVREATPMVVQCPRCKALVGRPCRSANRNRAPHDERVDAMAEWKRSRSA